MQIDTPENLQNQKPKHELEVVGIFKLKDKEGRNAVALDLKKAGRPIEEAEFLYISKAPGENNKIKIVIQWRAKNE